MIVGVFEGIETMTIATIQKIVPKEVETQEELDFAKDSLRRNGGLEWGID